MATLVKHREYTWSDDGKPVVVNVPVQWLRDFCGSGGRVGLFENPRTHVLEIRPIEKPSKDSEGQSKRQQGAVNGSRIGLQA